MLAFKDKVFIQKEYVGMQESKYVIIEKITNDYIRHRHWLPEKKKFDDFVNCIVISKSERLEDYFEYFCEYVNFTQDKKLKPKVYPIAEFCRKNYK